jgi:type II secretory pathway pseudopilin PulG
MEDSTNLPNIHVDDSRKKLNKGILILLVIIVLVLGATVGILLSWLNDQKKEAAEVQEILEMQKQSLEEDLTDLQDQFGTLQTSNDSLLTLASEQQDKITKLLAVQADNAYKIKMYQKELATLREVLKSYIVQVDSLNTRNQVLTAEKKELTQTLEQERARRERLAADKDNLTTTVQKAQILSVADISVEGLTNKSRETMRVKNIEKLKTCFTVRENQVALPGERVFYIVITKPDKKVMANRNSETFSVQEGGDIVYTAKRTVEYENRDIEACIFADGNNRLTAGTYNVDIYCEGYLLGNATFLLK